MSWKDLDIKLKAELIKLGIRSGIKDINLIRQLYDNVQINDYLHPYYTSNTVSESNIQNLNQDNILIKGMIDDFNNNKHNIPQLNIYSNELDTERVNVQQSALFLLFKGGGYISNNPTLALVGKVKKYDEGGLKDSSIILDYIFNGPLKRKKENSLEYRQALFNNVDPRNGYPSPWTAVKYYNTVVDALNAGDTSKKWETDGSVGQETAAAGWAKFLGLPYNEELFPVWNGDTVRLSPELEREIPIDTNLLKLDIQRIIYDRNLDRSMGIFDREEAYKTLLLTKQLALNNLRKTYKTGEWVQMNEFMGNSVNPFDWNEDYVSPLNVLLFYGLKYDKNTNSMLYGDLYNLNAFDYFLPGKPFMIRGSIPLDLKKNGGFLFPNLAFSHKFAEGGNPDGEGVVLIEPDTTTDVLNVDTSRYDRNYLIDIDSVPKVSSLDEILNAKPEYVVPKGNAENTYAAKVNEYNNKNSSRDREARLKSLKEKSEKEIKELQRSYADQGFYDFELKTGKSKEARTVQRRLAKEGYISYKDVDGSIGSFTTKALLQMLIEKGYLPEFNEYGKPNKDGIIGKRTREAFKLYNRDYNVDGIAGTLTESIYLQGNKQTIVSAEGMLDLCARWVSKLFETNIGNTKQNGVFGNAWNMLYNIKDQGGEMLFNLYEDPAFDSVTTGNGVKNTINSLLKTVDMNSLYSLLQVNDIVGIHMPSSSHFQEVLDSGTTYNTHVGIVTGFKNGVPIISHNINGKVKTEPINNLTGQYYGKPVVTVASRPKKSSNVEQELVFDNTIKSTLHVPEGKENNLMSEYMDSLALAKLTFKDIYTEVDMDFIEKAAVGITGVETNFMNTKQSDLRERGNPQALLRSEAHWIKQTNEEVKSLDLTKMKFNTLSSEYRKSIGLTSPEQLSEDPIITGRAVFLTLCKYYDYFQRLAKENPKLGLTKLDIENATILSYNRGFASTHTLGFDKQGFGTPEELEYLRKAGEVGSRERDISSTNYKYLGGIGEVLYDRAYPEGSLTYVGRVRGYMEKI